MFQRILGALLGVALLGIALVFASVLLALVAAFALVIWGWLWWRTRHLRRALKEREDSVIEGEYRVESEVRRDIPGVERRPD